MFTSDTPFEGHTIETASPPAETDSQKPEAVEDSFHDLTRRLRVRYPIDRAVLIVGNRAQTEYYATASFQDGCCRHLSMRVPGESSLIRQVAEGGCLYTESFCSLFSGNELEKKLLLDSEAQAYALVPLKVEARVVGLIGLSSRDPHAFSLIEESSLDSACDSLSRRIAATFE